MTIHAFRSSNSKQTQLRPLDTILYNNTSSSTLISTHLTSPEFRTYTSSFSFPSSLYSCHFSPNLHAHSPQPLYHNSSCPKVRKRRRSPPDASGVLNTCSDVLSITKVYSMRRWDILVAMPRIQAIEAYAPDAQDVSLLSIVPCENASSDLIPYVQMPKHCK